MIFRPHNYQQYCIDRVVEDPAIGLMLDMGLGKTVITLMAINALKYRAWAVSRVLIVAPKKVAEATWQKEATKWDQLRHLRISTVLGSAQQRIRALNTPADIWIINRENVPWIVDYYRNDWPFDMVVLDESSSFKNHRTKRFKALKLVRSRINRIVELTGTPAPNGLIDLWAQIYLLDGGQRLGRTIGQYRYMYFVPGQRNRTTVFTWDPIEGADSSIQAAISDICVSMSVQDYRELPECIEDEIPELPECIEDEIPVVLDGPAQRAYQELERKLVLQVNDDTITAGTAAVLTNKLLQLCDGAAYGEDGKAVEIHDCKIQAFLETVEQLHGEHALVFYNFQHDRDRMLEALKPTGLRVRLYQGPEDDAAWNAGEVDILLAHPASCAFGLNLQDGGHYVIWFGLTWSLELYQQANKRLHRQGQQYPVVIHPLVVQGGVDEDVMAALHSKGDTQSALLTALRARIEKVRK